ncbi:MAG: hypothetical protein DWI57_18770 [Chloroflexi bacterium]|nr:MAG: hypothetical protein DWI57_18770 [Chloroflexota bacterium]
MVKYILLYTGGGMPDSPEEGAKVMQSWRNWMGSLGEALSDGGNPFGNAKSIASDGSVSDATIGVRATGYSVLNADSLEAAVTLAQGCPHLQSGGQISVYETIEM